MNYPVDLSLLEHVDHMPALPVLERSMARPELRLKDFCIPVNSYFPSPRMMRELKRRLGRILRYYPSGQDEIARLLANWLQVDPDRIVAANGSTELISWLNQSVFEGKVVTDVPTFGRWTDNPKELGRPLDVYFRRESEDFVLDPREFVQHVRRARGRAAVICNPNNPTGQRLSLDELSYLFNELADLDCVVVDESFIDFAEASSIPSAADLAKDYDNVVILKSLGKNLGLHGVRCGYALGAPALVSRLRKLLPPWNLNSVAEQLVRMVNRESSKYERARRQVVRDTAEFYQRLRQLPGVKVFEPNANFVFCRLPSTVNGINVRNQLLVNHGIFVRECGSKIGITSSYLRIASRPVEAQDEFVQSLGMTLAALGRRPDVRLGVTEKQVTSPRIPERGAWE